MQWTIKDLKWWATDRPPIPLKKQGASRDVDEIPDSLTMQSRVFMSWELGRSGLSKVSQLVVLQPFEVLLLQ